MAATFNTSGKVTNGATTATTFNISVDIGSLGTNPAVAFKLSFRYAGTAVTATALTWNGTTVDFIQATRTNAGINLQAVHGYLVNPASGSNTLALTVSSSINVSVEVIWSTYNGVLQTQASVSGGTNTGSGNQDPSIAVTPSEGGCAVEAFYVSGSDTTLTIDGWATAEPQTNDSGTWVQGFGYVIQTTAVTTTATWQGANDQWCGTIIALKAASSNTAPTIALGTTDGIRFASRGAVALTATGSDADGQDLVYQVEIGDNPSLLSGEQLIRSFETISGMAIHANAHVSAFTYEGDIAVDDRGGNCYRGGNGTLSKIEIHCGDARAQTNGQCDIRVYAMNGAFGVSHQPRHVAVSGDKPTRNALARSADTALGASFTEGWKAFTFTGAQQLRQPLNAEFLFLINWKPVDRDTNNIWQWNGSTTDGSIANGSVFVDRHADTLNQPTWLGTMRVYETFALTTDSSNDGDGGGWTRAGDSSPFTQGQAVTYTPPASVVIAENVVYYYRMRCQDTEGEWSTWSAVRSFVVGDLGGEPASLRPAPFAPGQAQPWR